MNFHESWYKVLLQYTLTLHVKNTIWLNYPKSTAVFQGCHEYDNKNDTLIYYNSMMKVTYI